MKMPLLRAADGEGSIKFPDDWRMVDGLSRADLLQDWLAQISAAYDEAVRDMDTEFNAKRNPQ